MKVLTLITLILFPAALFSQNTKLGDFSQDETVFYAQTKQVNQFFRRFNAEEDAMGKRTYVGDSVYRDLKARKKYLNILFDNSNYAITATEKNEFIDFVSNKKTPFYLDFHGKGLFAEVSSTFTWKKEKVSVVMYLRLEHQNLGYKWVISNVYFSKFDDYFVHLKDSTNVKMVLHPMSHELDFMNIHKIFNDYNNLDYYLEEHYKPDHLALFVEEVKNGNLKFDAVNNVKFHFFQVPGWYFEVNYVNRNNMNSGWLITNLLKINENDKKELIRNYTHEK
ncbi:MAG TPA: hypothetical protein VLR52_00925 [Bacteroidales bacterium]|nr:hypothetical protein [Bacteroidales bacterium]